MVGFEIGKSGWEVMDYTVDVDLVYTSFFAKVFAIGFLFSAASQMSQNCYFENRNSFVAKITF